MAASGTLTYRNKCQRSIDKATATKLWCRGLLLVTVSDVEGGGSSHSQGSGTPVQVLNVMFTPEMDSISLSFKDRWLQGSERNVSPRVYRLKDSPGGKDLTLAKLVENYGKLVEAPELADVVTGGARGSAGGAKEALESLGVKRWCR
jgi:hypothetical protein